MPCEIASEPRKGMGLYGRAQIRLVLDGRKGEFCQNRSLESIESEEMPYDVFSPFIALLTTIFNIIYIMRSYILRYKYLNFGSYQNNMN